MLCYGIDAELLTVTDRGGGGHLLFRQRVFNGTCFRNCDCCTSSCRLQEFPKRICPNVTQSCPQCGNHAYRQLVELRVFLATCHS